MRAFDNPYAGLLRQSANFVEKAWVAGRLFLVKGHDFSYPVLLPENVGGQRVTGEVYHFHHAGARQKALQVLDAYEGVDPQTGQGEEYMREILEVVTVSGEGLQCMVYAATALPNLPEIRTGDFLKYTGN